MKFATVKDRYSSQDIEYFYTTGQWTHDTLFDLIEAQATLLPDKVFLTDNVKALTFGSLRDEVLSLALGLRRLGLGVGDRVSVQIPNWVEFAVIAAALSRLGAILVPIMPIYRREEVGYILKNAGVKFAFTSENFKSFEYLKMYEGLRSELVDLQGIVTVRGSSARGSDFTRSYDSVVESGSSPDRLTEIGPGVTPDDHFVIVYSSGTTSRPKGCLHTFNTMACGARLLSKGFGYSSDDVQFGPSPVTHTTGLVTSIILPLINGAASHLMESWEPKGGLEQIAKFKCTVAVTAATFLYMLLDVFDLETDDASSMRLWVAAGSPIPSALLKRAKSLLPELTVLSLYGRTENITTTMCTVEDEEERSLTSDGKALPFQSVKIVGDDGVELPRGQEGDISYKGAMHMLEYINNPTETAALFTADGHSRSGDLGYMDEDGYVRVTGRLKDIVIRGGLNISVRQVEDLLVAHPGVKEVAVVGMPDERLGERICCYVVPQPGYGPIDLESVKSYLTSQGLAIQKMPERLEIIEHMPMTATGKIQKHLLRADIASKVDSPKGTLGG